MDAPQNPELATADLRFAIARLSRRLRAERAVETMSDGQMAVLAGILWGGLRTLTELAEHERVTTPSMNRTVNTLETAGYVSRSPDEHDRRKVIIRLTDAGRRVMEETQRRRNAWLENALAELTPEQRAVLAAAVPIMQQVAER